MCPPPLMMTCMRRDHRWHTRKKTNKPGVLSSSFHLVIKCSPGKTLSLVSHNLPPPCRWAEPSSGSEGRFCTLLPQSSWPWAGTSLSAGLLRWHPADRCRSTPEHTAERKWRDVFFKAILLQQMIPQASHPVVVHQQPQPRFDALHDILQKVLLHHGAVMERQVPHMNGAPYRWESHELREILLVFRLL